MARACGDLLPGRVALLEEVEGAGEVARDGAQRLVQLVGQRRGHLAHGGEARGRLQPLLLLALVLLGPLLLGHVQDGAHPSRLAAVGVLERRVVDHHGEARAVGPLEHRLVGRGARLARQHLVHALLVLVHALGRPVGHRRRLAHERLLRQAHHAAEGGVHEGDAPVHVARAQPDHGRIAHRAAEGHLVAQPVLGAHAPRTSRQRAHRLQKSTKASAMTPPRSTLAIQSGGPFTLLVRRMSVAPGRSSGAWCV